MHLVRCDRCKREIRSYDSKGIEIREKKEKRRFLLVIDEYSTKKDLCEECHKALINWLGGN